MLVETIIREVAVEHNDMDCPVIGGSHSMEFCAFPGSHELEYDRTEEHLRDIARVGFLSFLDIERLWRTKRRRTADFAGKKL